MKQLVFAYNYPNAAVAMQSVLTALLNDDYPPGNKGTVAEIQGATLRIDMPEANLIISPERKFNYAYNLVESIWNLTNTRDVEVLRQYNSKIDDFIADQDDF